VLVPLLETPVLLEAQARSRLVEEKRQLEKRYQAAVVSLPVPQLDHHLSVLVVLRVLEACFASSASIAWLSLTDC
jgi:hypothetical protein